MQAVVRKSQSVKQDAAGFFTSMAVTATRCVLLAINLLENKLGVKTEDRDSR